MRASAFLSSLVMFLAPVAFADACREKASVQMDERAAESHLLAKKDPELPASEGRLIRSRRVVVLVTVGAGGAICDARAVRGPEELQQPAEDAVRKSWKYRPFLVNWKPAVAQFPVTVRFLPPRAEPEMSASLQ